MDAAVKELVKLEKLTSTPSSPSKGKSPSIDNSLDFLLETLHDLRQHLMDGIASEEEIRDLSKVVDARKKEIDDRQKEVYNTLARYGKALDKVSYDSGSETLL